MRDDPYTLPGELLGRRGRPGIALIETKRLVGGSANIDHSAIFDRAKRNAGEAKITEGHSRRQQLGIRQPVRFQHDNYRFENWKRFRAPG